MDKYLNQMFRNGMATVLAVMSRRGIASIHIVQLMSIRMYFVGDG